MALRVAVEKFSFQREVGNETEGVVSFLFPQRETATAHADDLVEVGRGIHRAVERLVLEDVEAAVVVVVAGGREAGGEAIGGDRGGEALDVSVVDAGVAFVGSDDVSRAACGPGGEAVRHVQAQRSIGHVEDVIIVGGVDGDRALAEAGDVEPGVGGEVEHGDRVVFLKSDKELGIVRAEGDVFRLDVEILGLVVIGLERGVVAQAADEAGDSAEIGGGDREGGKGRGEGVLIQAGQVGDGDGAGLLDAVESGDVNGTGSGPGVLGFVGDGDLAVLDGDHVRVVAGGHGADDGAGFEIEEYQTSELWDGRRVVGAVDVDG